MSEHDEEATICDRCAAEVPVAETQNGPPGEWENCTLCNDCYAEENANG